MKLNSRIWKTLKSSVVIFQTLEPLQPQWPPQPQQPPWPQWPLQPHFIKNIIDCDGWIIPGTIMTNTGPFLWNGSSKIQFFTDISTISVKGCWGFQCYCFWKLVEETQMPTIPEATNYHSSRKFSILLPSAPLRIIHFTMRHTVQTSTAQHKTKYFLAVFNILKEPLLVQKQTIHQQKALNLIFNLTP